MTIVLVKFSRVVARTARQSRGFGERKGMHHESSPPIRLNAFENAFDTIQVEHVALFDDLRSEAFRQRRRAATESAT